MTTVQTFNRQDLQQTAEDLERVRRDSRTNPGSTPSAYVNEGGATVAVPGNELAPFAQTPPFPTPEQDYGEQDQVIGYVADAGGASNTGPLLNVEGWRKITIVLRYVSGAANGQLAVMPRYGNSDEFPLPLMVPADALTIAGNYGRRVMYYQEFLTPLTDAAGTFNVKLTFDVSAYTVFALSLRELEEDITCTGEDPTCSRVSIRYSLSM